MTSTPDAYSQHVLAVTGTDPELLRRNWEPDGVVEFPYAVSVGTPTRLEGIDAIVGYFFGGHSPFADWSFGDIHTWKVENADEFVAETHGSATVVATGAPYEQDYIVRFGLSANGRLQWLREFWDPTRADAGSNGSARRPAAHEQGEP